MQQVSHWLKPLAVLTVTAFAWTNPAISSKGNATTAADLKKNANPIEISVPPAATDTNRKPIEIFVPPPEKDTISSCSESLQGNIDTIVNRPAFAGGRWGILVESLGKRNTIYSRNANQHLIPASNIKLFTTATALQRLDLEGSIRSKSIREWITVTNLDSNNGSADLLLRYLGGPQAVKAVLTPLGVDPHDYQQVDGSGLSRQNSATPAALVATLRAMHSISYRGDIFYTSLPVAGISGTLKNRLRNTSAQGRVHAKTGTLSGVSALSGYVENPEYGTLVFSIIVNHPNQSGQVMTKAIDEIVVRLTQLTRCK
jgi:D-alanyl-D-alanine carboxypeptidase/D-alanyl-D-alanine-endopeptidase (penicillin-binding protein 4)